MLEKVRNYIELHHMIEKGDRIVMGISGGADSVALLLLLNQLKGEYDLQLYAVHVNHGIRKEKAKEDADYVEQLCRSYQIPFFLFEADIRQMAQEEGRTEEEMGRTYRYQCFSHVMKEKNADKVAVAHHMGDQAETVLFHLVRGSNLSGMAGILPVNDLYIEEPDDRKEKKGTVIRPLLQCRKEELTDWLNVLQINWQEDATNLDNRYARNRIRNLVLPVLEEVNAKAVEHIAEFADSVAAYKAFFQHAVTGYWEKNVILEEKAGKQQCRTERRQLYRQEKILSMAVLYEMLTSVCGVKKDILKEHVQAVYELLNKSNGKKIRLPYGTEAVVSYENLIIRKCLEEVPETVCWKQELHLATLFSRIDEKEIIALPFGGCLTAQIHCLETDTEQERDCFLRNTENFKNIYTKVYECDTIKDTLCVRTPEKEDYFIMDKEGRRKKLSRYFIDEKIPLMERKKTIVVADDHDVLWIIGGRRCETYKINKDTRYVLILTYEGENNELSY